MTLISIPPTPLVYLSSGQMKQKFVELAATFEMDTAANINARTMSGFLTLSRSSCARNAAIGAEMSGRCLIRNPTQLRDRRSGVMRTSNQRILYGRVALVNVWLINVPVAPLARATHKLRPCPPRSDSDHLCAGAANDAMGPEETSISFEHFVGAARRTNQLP
jgi:hypothetical protein